MKGEKDRGEMERRREEEGKIRKTMMRRVG